MRRRIFPAGLLLAMIVLSCAVLYWNGDYVVYMLAYIFSFVFLLCYVGLSGSAVSQKVIQMALYALILAAQILFAVMIMRPSANEEPGTELCRLLGILIIFMPFIVRQVWGLHK